MLSIRNLSMAFPVNVLHREKMLAINFANVVDTADIWMAELPCETDFGMEEFQTLRVGCEIFRKKLQRDGMTKLQVIGPVHFTHSTFAA